MRPRPGQKVSPCPYQEYMHFKTKSNLNRTHEDIKLRALRDLRCIKVCTFHNDSFYWSLFIFLEHSPSLQGPGCKIADTQVSTMMHAGARAFSGDRTWRRVAVTTTSPPREMYWWQGDQHLHVIVERFFIRHFHESVWGWRFIYYVSWTYIAVFRSRIHGFSPRNYEKYTCLFLCQ